MIALTARIVALGDARVALATLTERDAGGLIYSHPMFLEFLSNVTNAMVNVVLAESGADIVGALPFMSLEQPSVGRVVNSLPWYGSHGGCVLDRERADANAIRSVLLERFAREVDDVRVLSATMILPHAEEEARTLYEQVLRPTVMDSRLGQITELPLIADEDALLGKFSKKTRNLVRKGLKQGFREVVSDTDEAWNVLHAAHARNMEALGSPPKPRAHFESLRKILPPKMRRLSLALDGDAPVAALLLLHGGATTEYVTPASNAEARTRQPLSFLIFKGMLDAIERGARFWNWGGTWDNQETLHHFKAGFGAIDKPYSYLTVSSERGLATLRQQRPQLALLFPYFYTYPYAALDSCNG